MQGINTILLFLLIMIVVEAVPVSRHVNLLMWLAEIAFAMWTIEQGIRAYKLFF
jgi:hypothetical protein